jgi:hypothetical protein
MKRASFIAVALLVLLTFGANGQVKLLHDKIINHGAVKQGEVIKGNIQFVNKGKEPLELEDVRASCGCTAVKPEKMIFEPGETAIIPYTIETKQFTGVIRKTIRLVFKDKSIRPEVIFVEANITTDLVISPRFINFQKVALNPDTTLNEFIEIQNNSQNQLTIKKIYADNEMLTVFPSDTVIPPGKSHLFRVDLKPTKVGRFNSSITVETDHKNFLSKNIPVFINIREEKELTSGHSEHSH